MATMQAIRISDYGGPEVMSLAKVAKPAPTENQVLVRVHAAGVNPVDWKIREGQVKDFLPLTPPFVLGCDISGVIESLGAAVSGYAVGDAVFGQIGLIGAFAEYAVLAPSRIAAKPENIDHVAAASVPVAALTAWQGLFREGGLKAGQRVLIHAAAGGVGSFAVQFGRHCGAHVIATASPQNHDYLRALGAHEVIDYHGVRFEDAVGDLDLVFDLIGGDTQDRSWATLKRGGVLVSSVGPTSAEWAAAAGASGKFVIGAPDAEGRDLREIAALLRAGTIRTSVHRVLPLADAARALEVNKAGGVKGKIVLKVRD